MNTTFMRGKEIRLAYFVLSFRLAAVTIGNDTKDQMWNMSRIIGFYIATTFLTKLKRHLQSKKRNF